MARDAKTGELIWAYNISPQDSWDFDEPLITPLIDITINGTQRKVALKAARTGEFYVWDRVTGEMVVEPWMFVWHDFGRGVDLKTSRPNYDLAKMSFTGLYGGKQYVAHISSGRLGNTVVAANAAVDASQRYRRQGTTLYVFKLPG